MTNRRLNQKYKEYGKVVDKRYVRNYLENRL